MSEDPHADSVVLDLKTLGRALYRLRRRADLSQAELGERNGVEQATIGRYETARSKALRDPALQIQLAKSMGFERADLIQAAREESAGKPITLDPPPAAQRQIARMEAAAPDLKIPTAVRVTIREDDYGLYEADEDDAPTAIDLSMMLSNPALRSLRIATDDIAPFAEAGSFVVYDLNGIPRKGQFAMLHMKSGAYLPRRYLRKTGEGFHLGHMVSVSVDGMDAWAEKVEVVPAGDIAGLYPIRLHGD